MTNTQPDYIALAMVVVLLLIVMVMFIRKWRSNRAAAKARQAAALAPKPVVPAPGTGGALKLGGVEPRIAAMLMAVVADQLDKPLNEIRFISIEEVDE